MTTRRDALRAGAGTAVGAAGLCTGAFATAVVRADDGGASGGMDVIDATHELHEGFPTYSGDQQFFMDRKLDFEADGVSVFELRINEHTGTHVDAPLHFSADGQSVAQIPMDNLVCPLVVVDIRTRAAQDPDAQLTPDDLESWIAAHGAIPDGACVAMLSGWGEFVGQDKFRNVREGTMHFPGFHPDATQMLLEDTAATGIAVDTLSLDYGPSTDFATHYAWLPAGRWGLECVANLDRLPASGATLIVGAPKHRGGTGGPGRVIALVSS